jgi:hypothetical protein
MGEEYCGSCYCSKVIRPRTPWDSTEARKDPSGWEGTKWDFANSTTKLWYCRRHTHLGGGRNEDCYSSTWRNGDHNNI